MARGTFFGRVVLLLVVTAVCFYAGDLGAFWNVHEVDTPPKFDSSSLAFTPAGQPAVAGGDDFVYYAVWDGSSWGMEIVDRTGCFYNPRLAFDSAGDPVIVYTESYTNEIRFACRDGVAWTTEVIDHGTDCSLAVDNLGNPCLTYYTSAYNGDLMFARRAAGRWEVEVICPVSAGGQHLVFDGEGYPAVCYYDPLANEISLARWDGALWSTEKLFTDVEDGSDIVMAVNTSGHPVICWMEPFNTLLYMNIAVWNGSGWDKAGSPSPVDGGGLSMAVDRSDTVLVSFIPYTDWRSVELLRFDGTNWNYETVYDSGGPDGFITDACLALDGQAEPAVVYHDDDTGDLRLARWTGSDWDHQTIAHDSMAGEYSSLAYDADGNWAVSYYESVDEDLKFARWNGTGWDLETVDRDGDAGAYCSLAFGPDGEPAIAYAWYDADIGMGALRYAHREQGSWRTENADAASGKTFTHCSLAFDPQGNPAISYRYGHQTSAPLRFVRKVGASWMIDEVDAACASAEHTSLAFDPWGNPAISYQDYMTSSTSLLKFARFTGSDWAVETIDDHTRTGYHTSLAFDAQGNPAISYSCETCCLRLARWNRVTSTWDIIPVDEEAYVEESTTLRFDADGNPIVGYAEFDMVDPKVKLARWENAQWRIETVAEGKRYFTGSSLAINNQGEMAISYGLVCSGDLYVAANHGPVTLYLGYATDLGPGWKASTLPLTSATDREESGFPVQGELPGVLAVAPPPSDVPLAFYRVLWRDGRPALNSLRATKDLQGILIAY